MALVAPKLGELQARASGFLGAIQGTSGALEWLAERYGVDLRTPEALAAAGLDPNGGLVVYGLDKPMPALVLGVSVRDPAAFMALAAGRLERSAGATRVRPPGASPVDDTDAAGVPPGTPIVFAGGAAPGSMNGAPAWRAAIGVTEDRIGILAIVPGADPVAAWQAAAGGKGAFMSTPRVERAKTVTGPGAVAWLFAADLLPSAPSALGLLQGAVDGILASLRTWEGGLVIADDKLVLKLSTTVATPDPATGGVKMTLPVTWVRPEGSARRLAEALPKTTGAFIRFRINLDKLRRIPSFIRDQVIPDQLPGFETFPIPSLPDLIEMVDGDIGVALLGIDPAATFGQLGDPAALKARLFKMFRVALIARVRDPAAAKKAFAGIGEQLASSGWRVAPIGGKGTKNYEGFAFTRESEAFSVLVDDQVIVFIVGPGEADAFVGVREGRVTSLASYAGNAPSAADPVATALGVAPKDGGTALGLTMNFLRATRELGQKGVPPYFLKILNDLRIVALSLDAREDGLDFALEIGL